jgi:hypothetical protein
MLTESDDLRHELGSDPDARESLVWNVLLPDAERYAIGYVTLKPSMESTRLLVIFGPDGDPVIEIAADRPFEGEDLDDFAIARMHISQPVRSQAMTVEYAGEQAGLRYRFDAVHAPFDFARNADGCAPVAATNRFEQAGRITGTLSSDGEDIDFATTGHRDHSWGVRDYGSIQHWKWISAQAGPDTAIHAMHTWFQGRQYTNGYVFRDGELSPIVELRVQTEYDAEMMQRRATFALATKPAGRQRPRQRTTGAPQCSSLGSSRSSRPGIHQFHLPASRMNAGTSIARTIVASISTAIASPNPICFISGIATSRNEAKIATMIVAAEVTTPPVRSSPRATASTVSPLRSHSSRIRLTMNTS